MKFSLLLTLRWHKKREGGGLRIQDVDLKTGEIIIRDSKDTRAKEKRQKKNKTGRVVFAQGETLEAIRSWWKKIRINITHQDPEDYFFCIANISEREGDL